MNWPSYLLLICRRKSTFYYIFLIFLLLLQEVIGHLLPDYDRTRVLLLLVALILPLPRFKVKSNFYLQIVTEEIRQRDLMIDDEEEDFLDECTVNPTGIQNIG